MVIKHAPVYGDHSNVCLLVKHTTTTAHTGERESAPPQGTCLETCLCSEAVGSLFCTLHIQYST